MLARNRMPDVRALALVLLGERGEVRIVHVMQPYPAEARTPSHDRAAHLRRQRLEGAVHVGEEGIAALGRELERMEERAGVGNRLVLAVGVPAPAGTLHAKR